jgi:Protein of unknown function (DUF1759)
LFLEEGAHQTSAHFCLSDSNYSVAIEILKDQYNDLDAAAEDLMKKILMMNNK